MDWESLEVPWQARAPNNERFERRRSFLLAHGMMATVSAWRSTHDGHTLIGLRVEPETPFMKEPPNRGTPWHVSIAFEPVEPRLYEAFLHHWARPRRVRLQFDNIGWNAVATLDPRTDPIAKDPVVRRMHEADNVYGWRPLHITF
jgi:hypothetical protein